MESEFPYQKIASELRNRLQSDAYQGARLPSERALMAEFDVQRATIRRALKVLETQGLVQRTQSGRLFAAPRAANAPGRGALAVMVRQSRNWAGTASHILHGAETVAKRSGRDVVWLDADTAAIHLKEAQPSAQLMRARGVDAVLLWLESPFDVALVRALRQELPVVLLDRRVPGVETDYVGFGDVAGGKAITQHLIRLGHRHIGFIDDDPYLPNHQDRMRGYFAALGEAGILRNSEYLIHLDGVITESSLLRRYFEMNQATMTAVVCANDIIASQVIIVLGRMGLRAPQDIAVTGFGNLAAPMLDALDLTTMALPYEQLGALAAQMAIQRLDGYVSPSREYELPHELIVRGSCGSNAK